jgi:predicted AAA+ superfamily ATPase
VSPFSLGEVSSESIQNLWLRGGFPRSYLASSDRESIVWREEYIRTYLERDLPMLGIQIPSQAIRRFWMMLAHYHGQIFNASELGRSMQLSDTTVRRYLEILCSTFMVGTLQPWFENIAKRQVKTPKVFIRDSGILHSLIGIHSHDELHTNPKLGASWEGFALEEVRRAYHCRDQDCYFWAVHEQAELDLLIIKDGRRLGFEVKYTDSPKVTKSMKSALELLKLDSLTIVCPGAARFQLADQIAVCGIEVVYEAAASTA